MNAGEKFLTLTKFRNYYFWSNSFRFLKEKKASNNRIVTTDPIKSPLNDGCDGYCRTGGIYKHNRRTTVLMFNSVSL